MANPSIDDQGTEGKEGFIAASTDISHEGHPTVIELIQVDGEYRIREFDLTDIKLGYFGLAAAFSAAHIANVWEVMTGDAATSVRIAGGTA